MRWRLRWLWEYRDEVLITSTVVLLAVILVVIATILSNLTLR